VPIFVTLSVSMSLSSTLFPYTTLFRSVAGANSSLSISCENLGTVLAGGTGKPSSPHPCSHTMPTHAIRRTQILFFICYRFIFSRSEEHTSELQSRENLVCRLLLEKKKE